MQSLINGFKKFQTKYFGADTSLYNRLKSVQTPKALVISCCDSRVDPALLFDCQPGDLFVVRNIANLVPGAACGVHLRSVIAAVEFSVERLRVGHIIVLGHSNCAGIEALLHSEGEMNPASLVTNWVDCATKTRDTVISEFPDDDPETRTKRLEQASIVASLENLRTLPALRRPLSSGALELHGWYFEMETGHLSAYKTDSDSFKQLA